MNKLRALFKLAKKADLAKPANNKSIRNCDLIGPADKISNIRQYKFYIPEKESQIENEYRLMRERVLEWNHQYWTQQNLNFIQSKRTFLENINKSKQIEKKFLYLNNQNSKNSIDNLENNDSIEINEFYKKFLNDNYHNHYEYNKKWFKLNLKMLWPAVRVHFYRLNKKLRSRN